MKRTLLLLAVSSSLVFACDDKKEKEKELLDKVGIEAGAKPTPTASVTGVNIVPPPGAGSVAVTTKPPKDCGTGDPVIDDKDFENELRTKTKPPKAEGTLTAKDLLTVTSVNLTKKSELKELDPCVFPKLMALKFLYLPKGEYRDLTPIKDLTKLEGLRISISEVEDLKPLEKLTALDQLDIGRTHVRDISPLVNNVNITELQLDDTQVSDISVLAKLTKLQKLSIKNTLVKDVSPLKDLKGLKTLDVAGCAIDNLNTLDPLKGKGLRINTK
ncbi:MAG: leucine-rich repeat domain-containing protein [Labilithrix sp.]